MKKAIAILLVLMLSLSVLAACDDAEEPEPVAQVEEPDTPAASEPEPTPEPIPEPEPEPDEPEPDDPDEPNHFSEVRGFVDAGYIQFSLEDEWFIEELRIFGVGDGWKESEGWFDEEDQLFFKISKGGGSNVQFQTSEYTPLQERADGLAEQHEAVVEEITINGVKYLMVDTDPNVYLLTSLGGFDLDSRDIVIITLWFTSLDWAMSFLETVSVP